MILPRIWIGIGVVAFLVAGIDVRGETPVVGERLLAEAGAEQARLGGGAAHQATVEVIEEAQHGIGRGWRVQVKEKQGTDHHVQLAVPVAGKIERGDGLYLEWWARLVATEDETTLARAASVIELERAPYSKVLNSYPWAVGREWTRLRVPFRSGAGVAAGDGVVLVRLGGAVQTVELGGVRLLRLPAGVDPMSLPKTAPELYAGHEATAGWRQEAEARIREHRMEELVVRVKDEAGAALAGVRVELEQVSHAFRFGSAVNASWLVGPNANREGAAQYREMIPQLFNQGTMESAHKWPQWESQRERADRALAWLQEQGLTVRGHVLIWPSWRRTPADLPELASDPERLKRRIEAHFESILAGTGGAVSDWDVVNEPQTHNDVLKVLGEDYVAEAFQVAKRLRPEARLFLNEALNFSSVDKLRIFEEQALRWRAMGAPIEGLGIQAHYSGWSLTPPERIGEELDRLAAHGFVLQVTEFDIDTVDEELQARYLRDFYTAVFAHPAVDTIQMWGFWEGQHWRPDAALWRRDWTIKPAGEAYLDLINRVWRTRETAMTNEAGEVAVRGFLGEYRVRLTHEGETRERSVTLTRGAEAVEVSWETAVPTAMVWDRARLDEVREDHRAGGELEAEALAVILREAENEFRRGPFTVTSKKLRAASGNPRDYYSAGPYWWPNPDTPDGLPYVRRDGEWNSDNDADSRAMGSLIGAVRRLGVAYHVTGEERYAGRAREFLRTWFLDEETGMTPHLKYAQAIPGVNDGRAIGMIDTWMFRELLEAVRLLGRSEAWSAEDDEAFRGWMEMFHEWFVNSEFGRVEAAAHNNHATWHLAQVAAQAVFLGREEEAKARLAAWLPGLVRGQIEADGRQPHELARTRSMHYSVYNLRAMLECALMARGQGLELDDETVQRLRLGVAYLEPYADPASAWPHPEIRDPQRDQLWVVFRMSALFFGEPELLKYEEVLPAPRETHLYYRMLFPGL